MSVLVGCLFAASSRDRGDGTILGDMSRRERMKKTIRIDEDLLREARSARGAETDTEAVRLGLEALVRHAAYERLRGLRGSESQARDVRRRRESAARRSAV